MTTESRISRKELDKLTLAQIVDDERVKTRFVDLYNARTQTKNGAAIYVQATESFMRAVIEDVNLQQCTPLSLYSAFLDMSYYGLTVSKSTQPLAYLLWNNVKTGGTKDAPSYEKRASLVISPYGEIAIRQSMGQVKHCDEPVIVYADDEYSGIIYKDGQKTVEYKRNTKSKNKTIVAAFVKITRPDGTVDFSEVTMDDIKRLEGYSKRKNRGEANALYSSDNGQIDSGFLKAKLLKHAFKSYPKVNNPHLNAQLETDIVEREIEETEDIYGVEDEATEAEVVAPDEITKPDESF